MAKLIPYLSFIIITTFTPGPNNIISMVKAGKNGIKEAKYFSFGVSLGAIVIMSLCLFFGGFLLEYIPAVKPYLTYIGAAYILYLAYKILRSSYDIDDSQHKADYGIKEGFWLQFVNPKGIIFMVTLTTTFILPSYSSPFVYAGFVLGIALLAIAATMSWALFGSAFQKLLKQHTKIINIILALVLVYTAVSLFL